MKDYKFKVNVIQDPNFNDSLKNNGFKVTKASVSLIQVTRDGKLKMKIMSPILTPDLIKGIKNDDF
jgi:hypothetical protein